tara:strand:- start:4636 stop:6132 length:1497 start_codon:yes stop_codon:yes gene_type:complete
MKNRVLLLGIDGATWDILDEWIDQGHLPILKKLRESGSSGNLNTVIPTLSCTAWTSLFTGKNPGKHGISNYLTKSGKLINSNHISEDKIWNTLSEHNKRSCIINVPVTYPVEKLNGYMVSSFLTPPNEKNYVYPPKLKHLLDKFDYKISIKNEKFAFLPDTEEIAQKKDDFLIEIYDVLDSRFNTLKELMKKEWDFFFVVFNESSSIQYLFWDKKDIMLEFYKKLDFKLGELIKIFKENNKNTTTFVVSDHGYSPAPTRLFNSKLWLQNEGLIKDEKSLIQKIIPKVYKKIIKTPLKYIFRLNKAQEIRESFQIKSTETSSIFFRSPGFFLNGNISEEIKNLLIQKLDNLSDPVSGDKIFKLVKSRESVYSGKKTNLFPNIIAIPNPNFSVIFNSEREKIFDNIKYNHPGRHNSDLIGIFISEGGEIRSAKQDISILDMFPTIFHILDVPIPPDIDGKVLKEIFIPTSKLNTKEVIYSDKNYTNEKIKIKSAIEGLDI